MRWTHIALMIISIILIGMSNPVPVHAGNWDEHFGLQTFVNDWALNSGVPWLDNGLATFTLGVVQHEVYDLLVYERPLYLNRVILQLQKEKSDPTNYMKEEEPTLIVALTGMTISLYKTVYQSVQEGRGRLGKRLLGLLGSITPDLLEGARLALMGPENAAVAWVEGDACAFHYKPPQWYRYPVYTFNDYPADLQRRVVLQALVVVL